MILLCLFITYTTPWIQSLQGNPLAKRTHSIDALSRHIHVLNPPLLASTIIDYPDQAVEILENGLGNVRLSEPNWWKDTEFRFAFYRGHGSAIDSTWTGFGAAWWGIRAHTVLRDVNTRRSSDGAFDYDLDSIAAGTYGFLHEIDAPAGNTNTARLQGGQLESRFFSVVNILDAVIVSVFVAFLLCSLVSKAIRPVSISLIVTLAVLLTAFSVSVGTQMTKNEHSITAHFNTPPQTKMMSRWYSDEEFKDLLTNADARSAFLRDELELVYAAKPGEQLVYQTRHGHGTEIVEYTAGYSEFHPIWEFIRSDFTQELEDGTYVHAPRCTRIPPGIDVRMDSMFTRVVLAYGGETSAYTVRIFWMKMLALIAIFWWLLQLIQWVSIRILYRVQAGRFEQGLCVVCKYPKAHDTHDMPPPLDSGTVG